MISLVLTHYNRFSLLMEAIAQVRDDSRITEIVISDDSSNDGSYAQLRELAANDDRIKLYRNNENVDSYINKARAVARAMQSWVVLLDSDNVLPVSYLDAAFETIPWEKNCAYLPVFAEPEFDYREFAGLTITRENVAEHMNRDMFATALNTGNYLIHRDEYLRVWDGSVTPHTSEPIYHNFCWLQAGNALFFVPGMTYFHRIHDGSHFVQNDHLTGAFAKKVETMLKMLR